MSIWRRPRAPRPARQRKPHPDPGRELQLRRILDLQASIGRRADLVAVYRDEIRKLHQAARDDGSAKLADMYFRQAGVLHARIAETEEAIRAAQAEIAALQAEIPDSDLAFL